MSAFPSRKNLFVWSSIPVNKPTINSVGIKITEGQNNILDLNGFDVAFSLTIEEIREKV